MPFPFPRFRRLVGSLLIAAAFGLPVGCQQQEDILQYTVKKEPPPPPIDPGPPVELVKKRTMGAIVQHGETTWYFKATGLDAPVEKHKAAFLKLIGSVRFGEAADANPAWTLPEGWTTIPGDENRFATIRTDSDPPLDISVTALAGNARKTEYLLANINRWRGQVGLPPTTAEKLFSESLDEEVRRETFHGHEVVLVDVAGQAPAGAGRPPFASPPFAGKSERPAPPATVGESLSHQAPEGWVAGKTGGLRKAAFTVADGDRKVEITVIDLAGQGGDWNDNVNRWRGQIGLPTATAEEIASATKAVAVASIPARSIELTSPEGKGRQSILAVMFLRGDAAWFIKLQGDAELAAREKMKFEQFVQSVRFR